MHVPTDTGYSKSSSDSLTPARGKQHLMSREATACFEKSTSLPTPSSPPTLAKGTSGCREFRTEFTSPGCGSRSCRQEVQVKSRTAFGPQDRPLLCEPRPTLESHAHIRIKAHDLNLLLKASALATGQPGHRLPAYKPSLPISEGDRKARPPRAHSQCWVLALPGS